MNILLLLHFQVTLKQCVILVSHHRFYSSLNEKKVVLKWPTSQPVCSLLVSPDATVVLFVPEPSPEPEHLEQLGETLPLTNETLSQRLRVHRTAVLAKVKVRGQGSEGVDVTSSRLLFSSEGRKPTGSSMSGTKFWGRTMLPCRRTSSR